MNRKSLAALWPIAVFVLTIWAVVSCAKQASVSGTQASTNPNRLSPGDYTQTAGAIPSGPFNDPLYLLTNPFTNTYSSSYLWGFDATAVASTYSGLSLPAQEIIVAVIDTGVDKDHPDLAGRLWVNHAEYDGGKWNNGIDDDGDGFVDDYLGWDFVNHTNNPADDNGHGTHVSGTIAAVGNNGIGIIGMAPWVRIMPLKVCDSAGACASSDIRAGISYAVAHGAKVINISLGGPTSAADATAFDDSIRAATDAGTLVVVASGNGNSYGIGVDTASVVPANVNHSVAVGAFRTDGTICTFSNRGWRVDLTAPGCANKAGVTSSGILSLQSQKCGDTADQPCSTSPVVSTGYVLKSGTSMATPHVAGMAAVAFTASPTATPLQIRQALLATAVPSAAGAKDWDFGQGSLRATNLITEAQTAPGLKIRSPLYGTTAASHTITFKIEARGSAVTWQLKYLEDTASLYDIDLSTAGTSIATGTVTAGTTPILSQVWTPPASGKSYVVILQGTVGTKKYFDTVLLSSP